MKSLQEKGLKVQHARRQVHERACVRILPFSFRVQCSARKGVVTEKLDSNLYGWRPVPKRTNATQEDK